MGNYRRNYLSGGHYFFTVTLADRQSTLLIDAIDCLRASVLYVKQRHPFTIDAWVVLPEHVHAIWTLPPGDVDYSMRWRQIKAGFSRSIPYGEERVKSRVKKQERGIWQRRFWEHTIRDEEDWRRHMDYVHYNPVKHGYVNSPAMWKYSSFQKAVCKGWYPPDWGENEPRSIIGFEWE